MKRIVTLVAGLLLAATSAFAQTPDADALERALAPAPRNQKEAATVIKWKADHTYDTLKKGTNKLVCYERTGDPGITAAFAAQCTSLANLDRVAQNRKFAAIADKAARDKALADAEANGTRVKPEFGSVWLTMSGADRATAQVHRTVAVPGATAQSLGLPDNNQKGGAWIMNAGTTTAHIMIPGT
jgi:hypothetical protein